MIINGNNKNTKTLLGHKQAVYVVKFSKDSQHILSGGQDKSIKLWNPYKGILIKSYDNINNHDVLDIAITIDNSVFASCGLDKQIYLVDSITGNINRRFYGHNGRINTIAFNSSENIIASGSYDCSVRIWDLKSHSREPIQILNNANDSISRVLISTNEITSVSVDGNLRTYDIRMGSLLSDNFETPLNGLDISSDEKYSLISGLDSKIRLFEMSSGEIVKYYENLHISKNYALTVKYSNDYDGFYTTSENGDIAYYDIINESNNKLYKMHSSVTSGFDIHPNKKDVFVSAGFDSKIILWDINSKLINM
jgi:mitogen-activated protein kinase organizer 1